MGVSVPYFGVLTIRILLFRVLYSGPLFSETPKCFIGCAGSIAVILLSSTTFSGSIRYAPIHSSSYLPGVPLRRKIDFRAKHAAAYARGPFPGGLVLASGFEDGS